MYNYYPYQQQFPQRQTQFANVPFQDVRFVTAEEAKGFMVMPNTSVLLIDRQNKMATVKMADPMGQSTTQQYRFELIGEPAPTEYVTAEQYKELLAKIENLEKTMGERV